MNSFLYIFLTGIIMGVVLLIVTMNILYYISYIKKMKNNKIALGPIKDGYLCKTPHAWLYSKVYLKDVLTNVVVCRVCGLVGATNYMVDQDSIDLLEKRSQDMEIQEILKKNFLEEEENEIRKHFSEEIRAGVSMDKLLDLHFAGQTYLNRFDAYASMNTEKETKKKEI